MPLDKLPVGSRAIIISLKDEFAYLYLLDLAWEHQDFPCR